MLSDLNLGQPVRCVYEAHEHGLKENQRKVKRGTSTIKKIKKTGTTGHSGPEESKQVARRIHEANKNVFAALEKGANAIADTQHKRRLTEWQGGGS